MVVLQVSDKFNLDARSDLQNGAEDRVTQTGIRKADRGSYAV